MPELKLPKAVRKGLTASHVRAPKMERETAKRLGGRVTPGSGAKDTKGDVRIRRVSRIECKTTKHKSFSVTSEMIRKIEDAVFGAGEVPAIEIELGTGQKCYVLPHGFDLMLGVDVQ